MSNPHSMSPPIAVTAYPSTNPHAAAYAALPVYPGQPVSGGLAAAELSASPHCIPIGSLPPICIPAQSHCASVTPTGSAGAPAYLSPDVSFGCISDQLQQKNQNKTKKKMENAFLKFKLHPVTLSCHSPNPSFTLCLLCPMIPHLIPCLRFNR
jgi:hypothetical protein